MIWRQTYLLFRKEILIQNKWANIPSLRGVVRTSFKATTQFSGREAEVSQQQRRCSSNLQSNLIVRHTVGYNQHILAPRQKLPFCHKCDFHTSHKINESGINETKDYDEKNPGIFERFKMAYKEYGYAMIAVHAMTSVVWYGSFVAAAHSGVDITPLLEYVGASQNIIEKVTSSGAGDFAVGYIMYKIATPVRYAVTLGCTQLTVKQLRKRGYMKTPSEEDSLRNLAKDGRSKAKEKIHESKEKIKHQVDDVPEKMKHRMEDGIDKMKHRLEDTSVKIKGRMEKHEGISKMRHRLEDANEKINKEFGNSFDNFFAEKSDDFRDRFKAQSKITQENLRKKTEFSKTKFSEDFKDVKDYFNVDNLKKEMSSAKKDLKEKISKDKRGIGRDK